MGLVYHEQPLWFSTCPSDPASYPCLPQSPHSNSTDRAFLKQAEYIPMSGSLWASIPLPGMIFLQSFMRPIFYFIRPLLISTPSQGITSFCLSCQLNQRLMIRPRIGILQQHSGHSMDTCWINWWNHIASTIKYYMIRYNRFINL